MCLRQIYLNYVNDYFDFSCKKRLVTPDILKKTRTNRIIVLMDLIQKTEKEHKKCEFRILDTFCTDSILLIRCGKSDSKCNDDREGGSSDE